MYNKVNRMFNTIMNIRIIKARLSEKVKELAHKYPIVYAVLYGSIVEGRYIPGESDIDLALKLNVDDKGSAVRVVERLISDLNIDNLDIVLINFAPFSLKYDILTRGEVIFCRDHEALFKDRLRIIKMYDDWLFISRHFIEREIAKVRR